MIEPIIIVAIITGILGLCGVITTGVLTYRLGDRSRRDTTRQTAKRDTISDRDGLIASLERRLGVVESKVTTLEAENRRFRDHNNILIANLWELVLLIRQLGHGDKIPQPILAGLLATQDETATHPKA